mgnify:CR=1 FL=1|tara:strand:- start:8068 stop:8376 length:309 start_codon:yes stop_codon:yes gene_type:complete
MIDFYLKLANEASMPTVLSDFYNEDGELVQNTSDYAIDVVGTLYEKTGATLTSDNGMEYSEMQAMTGWHVNIRLVNDTVRETVEALDASYGVTPETPMRVWL